MEHTAACINLLGGFLGMRDVPALTPDALRRRIGAAQADVMVLFGGSILAGGDVLAQAMAQGVARCYAVVGGAGHTTPALRRAVHSACPGFDTAELSEAECFAGYLRRRFGLEPDLLECRSTNCGNNVTHLLSLLRAQGVPCRSIILTQDAAMQRRMDAGLRLHAPEMHIVNYAAYAAQVIPTGAGLRYAQAVHGMWDVARYVELLMGEIPRLTDDEAGYGPRGRGFIAHVDIPPAVAEAYGQLRRIFPDPPRPADPRFASPKAT